MMSAPVRHSRWSLSILRAQVLFARARLESRSAPAALARTLAGLLKPPTTAPTSPSCRSRGPEGREGCADPPEVPLVLGEGALADRKARVGRGARGIQGQTPDAAVESEPTLKVRLAELAPLVAGADAATATQGHADSVARDSRAAGASPALWSWLALQRNEGDRAAGALEDQGKAPSGFSSALVHKGTAGVREVEQEERRREKEERSSRAEERADATQTARAALEAALGRKAQDMVASCRRESHRVHLSLVAFSLLFATSRVARADAPLVGGLGPSLEKGRYESRDDAKRVRASFRQTIPSLEGGGVAFLDGGAMYFAMQWTGWGVLRSSGPTRLTNLDTGVTQDRASRPGYARGEWLWVAPRLEMGLGYGKLPIRPALGLLFGSVMQHGDPSELRDAWVFDFGVAPGIILGAPFGARAGGIAINAKYNLSRSAFNGQSAYWKGTATGPEVLAKLQLGPLLLMARVGKEHRELPYKGINNGPTTLTVIDFSYWALGVGYGFR